MAVEALAGAFGTGPGEEAPVEMKYAGLEGRRVAVVASLDPALARRNPDLGPALAALLADRFARHVPGARVLPPEEVAAWQRTHPWWESVPAGRVTAGLGVERLVRVEVSTWRTTQGGNANVLEGQLDTAVQVYEDDAAAPPGGQGVGDPDRPVFLERVSVRFPEDSEMGLPTLGDSGDPGPEGIATPGGPDRAGVGRQLLATWIRRAGPLFYDQEEAEERDRERAQQRAALDAAAGPEAGPA